MIKILVCGVCIKNNSFHQFTQKKIKKIYFLDDANKVVFLDVSGRVCLFNLDEKKIEYKFHKSLKSDCQISVDAKRKILVASDSKIGVVVWNIKEKNQFYSIFPHTDKILSIAISNDSKFLATGDESGYIAVTDIFTGLTLQVFLSHESPVTSITFCDKSRTLITGYGNGLIAIWDMVTGKLQLSFRCHENKKVNSLLSSFKDELIISAGDDKKIRFWVSDVTLNEYKGGLSRIFKTRKKVPQLSPFFMSKIKASEASLTKKTDEYQNVPFYSERSDFFKSENLKVDWSYDALSKDLNEWRREREKKQQQKQAKKRFELREARLEFDKIREQRIAQQKELDRITREKELRQQREQQRTQRTSSWGSSSTASNGKTYVKGYTKSDGTKVKGHYRNK